MAKKFESHPKKLSIETFRNVGNYELQSLLQKEPSCFNGSVKIKKYRVTIELVDEPDTVYTERIQHLWDYSKNYHDHTPLLNAAKSIGYQLKGERGNKIKDNSL